MVTPTGEARPICTDLSVYLFDVKVEVEAVVLPFSSV